MMQPLVPRPTPPSAAATDAAAAAKNNGASPLRKTLSFHDLQEARPSGVRTGGGVGLATATVRAARHAHEARLHRAAEAAGARGVIFPWGRLHRVWWPMPALAALATLFWEPYVVAFAVRDAVGRPTGLAAAIDQALTLVFLLDMLVTFNLAFYRDEVLVYDRAAIWQEYVYGGRFGVDLVGVFPFEAVMLALAGPVGATTALYLSLLRLLRLVRLYRLRRLSDFLQYNARVSLLAFTLVRNMLLTVACTHGEACGMYFLARLRGFGDDTWLGPRVDGMTAYDRYITALYFNIVTFCTVGYGDFTPANAAERTLGCACMLLNIVVAAFIIGSMTLLIVKGDERTGEYRESLQTLHEYGTLHGFDAALTAQLQRQLRLGFHNREIADERVLRDFPSSLRRRILRKLYLRPLLRTRLLEGVRAPFVDAFLASCTVEIFSPGETIVERGAILSDLFLLVGGIAEVTPLDLLLEETVAAADGSDSSGDEDRLLEQLQAGDLVGEIGFFTESPQVESVTCLTVCKTLTMSRSAYKLLAEDHPGSVGKILHNLLKKVEEKQLLLPRSLSILRAGSTFDIESGYGSLDSRYRSKEEELGRQRRALAAVKDLVRMHLSKQQDDQTTRLLFAASRGDTATIALMCDQGFDADSADYDQRTALMVAAMKGNTDVVKLLLKYQADPNLTDMHGSTALHEAAKNGHEATLALLRARGARLGLSEGAAASALCRAVFDGDVPLLERLLRAGAPVDAADYDGRTAAHIAAAEGNLGALKALVRRGANLTRTDRWGNTVRAEAERSRARPVLEFLEWQAARAEV